MPTKIWQVEGIRNHLLAVQTGVQASVPASLISDSDEYIAAYREGSQATLKFLAEGFGIDLERPEAARQRQTGELRLNTWSREDIERILNVAWIIMRNGLSLSQQQDEWLVAYYQGSRDALQFLALSFGIDDFTLPENI